MAADRFDAVARALTDGASRRTALGLSLGGLLGVVAFAAVDGKRKGKKKSNAALTPIVL